MLKVILQATENFCIHQIRLPFVVSDEVEKLKTFIAHIDISTQNDKLYRVYIAGEKDFVQKISMVFLEEDESDEETLIDMTLETANLIVGSAKVIAKGNNQFTIGTPEFLKIDYLDVEYDAIKTIKVEDANLLIAIKDIS